MFLNTNSTLSDIFYLLSGFKKNSTRRQKLMMVLAHVIGWILFFSLIPVFFNIQILDRNFFYKELINKTCLIGFFYFNYLFLVPRFLLKKKIAFYGTLLLFSYAVIFAQHLFVERQFLEKQNGNGIRFADLANQRRPLIPPGADARVGDGKNPGWPPMPAGNRIDGEPPLRPNLFIFVMLHVFYPWVFFILLGGFIHVVHILLKNQDEKKSLETANLKAEVNLLKSQVNPHFLFNTLNGIYSQVYHNSQHAGSSILKLSEILRYVIYDSSAETTPLSKDLHYVSNYISLQQLRLSDKVKVDYSVKGNLEGLNIAPLLLITFIENAFKHGISYSSSSVIAIGITVFSKTITMVITNPVIANSTFETGGIGLANARRRLDLLYPGRFLLDIQRDEQFFSVHLQINLDHD